MSETDHQVITYDKTGQTRVLEKRVRNNWKNASETIEQIASEQKEISRNHIKYIPHLKTYLNNIPTTSLSILFWRNTDTKTPILTTDQWLDTNRTRMEHLSL